MSEPELILCSALGGAKSGGFGAFSDGKRGVILTASPERRVIQVLGAPGRGDLTLRLGELARDAFHAVRIAGPANGFSPGKRPFQVLHLRACKTSWTAGHRSSIRAMDAPGSRSRALPLRTSYAKAWVSRSIWPPSPSGSLHRRCSDTSASISRELQTNVLRVWPDAAFPCRSGRT